jgi:hypothetical protein
MKIFPRPVTPRSAASDLWDFVKERRAHKWPLLALSATLTGVIIWAFIVDANTNTLPRQNQIIYFQSWDKSKRESEIIREQKRELVAYERAVAGKQKEMQHLADTFGIEWRKDAQRNARERAEAIRQINAMLDARLANALAKEKSAGINHDATDARPAPLAFQPDPRTSRTQ